MQMIWMRLRNKILLYIKMKVCMGFLFKLGVRKMKKREKSYYQEGL